jgi:PAS domain S-box-containing protein
MCLRLLGYKDSAEFIGKNMHKIMHHSHADGTVYPDLECRIIYLAFRRGGGSHVNDEVVWRADGTSFPVEYWSFPIHENNLLIGAVVTFIDISERRRVNQALQQTVKIFGQLAEHIREIFFVIALDPPRVVYASPSYQEIFGRPCQELYARVDAWMDRVHPEDRHHVEVLFEQCLQGLKTNLEYRLVRPDQAIVWIYGWCFPVCDEQGKLNRIVGIAEDITAQKQAKSEFLASMSHEIRTDESHYRNDRAAARYTIDQRAVRIPSNSQDLRRLADENHRRHSGCVQKRRRQITVSMRNVTASY